MSNLDVIRDVLFSEADMVDFVAQPSEYVGPERLAALHPEIRSAWIAPGQRTEYEGLAGFVEGWRDWVEPYTRYEMSTERLVDRGDRVVSLVNVVAVTRHDRVQITHSPAAVWTFRDGVVVEAEFYLDREQALEAVGD